MRADSAEAQARLKEDSPLVARPRETAAVSAFLDRVPSGPVGLVIQGEPGIGKTTIWLEAIRQAEGRGCRVLQARPAEREAQLSFAALGDLFRDVMPEVQGSLPQPQRDALHAVLLIVASAASVDPRTLATGLVSVLRALAAERPVVIAIDDVQWLDRASERALEFAFRRLPSRTGVLLARRSVPRGRDLDLVAAIGRDAITELQIGAMPEDGLHRLLAAEAPSLGRSAIARVAAASDGNPLHALEIVRAVRDGGAEARGPLPVPPSLEDLVRERVDRLSDRARAAATAVSASFRATRVSVAFALSSDEDVDAALLEAEEAGVLTWDDERLRFTHPLLGSALYAALSTGRRRALHRRLAGAADDPEETAHHLVGSIVGTNEAAAAAIEYGAAAAERRGAVDAAADLYRAARERTPVDDGDARARRAVHAATAAMTAGDLKAAQGLAEEALASTANGQLRARALVIVGSIASYTGTIEQRIAAHEAALREVEGDADLRAEVLLELGERMTIDPWQARHQAEEAARLLRAAGDTARLARALVHQVMASAVLGHGAPQALIDEVVALEAAAPRRAVNSLIWFHWMDDAEATRERYELQARLAREEGDDLALAELAEFQAMADFRAGRWQDAARLIEEACLRLGELEIRGPLTASFADRSVIDAHLGRLDQARGTLRKMIEGDIPLDAFWVAVCLSALGAVEFVAGDFPAADRAWTAMRRIALSLGWLEFPEDRSEPDHIEALLALGERDRARELLGHLEWRGRTLPRPWIDATLPRARALVMAAQGRLDEALGVIEAAPDVPGLPFERARLLMVRGQLERRSNRRLAARQSLEAALSIVEQLGSPPWIERTREEIGRLGLRHRDRHELTAMERRIAELAATGLTNRQVADAAFVSPKTVEANLARVYGKLGIRSRAELGARMGAGSPGLDAET